ncbi:MAG: acetate--CoA ligase family protein [Acidimicrobiia bacterium]|nr:acetate--CoA ligase family protein [Acidimicrobiia bacterium]
MTPPPTTWSEHESKRLLAQHGVAVAAERLVASGDEAGAAADELGYPVVAKLCGRAIAHKTERGLVRLALGDRSAVEAAAADLLAAAEPDDGDVGVLIAEMVSGRRELIVGVAIDEQFGPSLMLGIGGIFAEALADVTFRLLPISESDAMSMIDDLTTQALLGVFRGEVAVDRRAVATALLAVASAAGAVEGLESIDVNPLIVVDGRPVAVDALVVTR